MRHSAVLKKSLLQHRRQSLAPRVKPGLLGPTKPQSLAGPEAAHATSYMTRGPLFPFALRKVPSLCALVWLIFNFFSSYRLGSSSNDISEEAAVGHVLHFGLQVTCTTVGTSTGRQGVVFLLTPDDRVGGGGILEFQMLLSRPHSAIKNVRSMTISTGSVLLWPSPLHGVYKDRLYESYALLHCNAIQHVCRSFACLLCIQRRECCCRL